MSWRNFSLAILFTSHTVVWAVPVPPRGVVLETDPSVTVGAPPAAKAPHARIEPTRAPTPYQAKPSAKVTPLAPPAQARPLAPKSTSVVQEKTPRAPTAPLAITAKKAEPAAAPSSTTKNNGQLTRAQLTSDVRGREPVDTLDPNRVTQTAVYYFTELQGLAGQTVVHRWEYQGEIKHEQKLKVSSGRYRTYSRKTLNPKHSGEWKVSISDGKGVVMDIKTFTFAPNGHTTAETP